VQRQLRDLQQRKLNLSELARELGVTPQHVRRVALGLGTSSRVLKRLEREWRRIEREAGRRV
jgi:transcriptional regulator with XRE-family HTH domain